jgi:hypothetical protein
VGQRELLRRGVASLDVQQRVKEIRVVTQGSGNSPQAADVLGMAPAGVVPAAV